MTRVTRVPGIASVGVTQELSTGPVRVTGQVHDWERALAAELAGQRIGQYGGPSDVLTPLFAVQSKVGGSFSERYWRWLSAIPRSAGRIPILIVGDAPGPGYRRRALVIMELGDWRDLHGEIAP